MSDTPADRTAPLRSAPLAATPWFPLVFATVAATAALLTGLAVGLATGDAPISGWQLAARWTARASACFFLLVFIAGPLWRSRKAAWISPVMRNRRYWGLAFAIAHTIHLGALTIFFMTTSEQPPVVTLLVGGLGYGLLLIMVVTSNNRSQRVLGRGWHRLHTICLLYIWAVFALSYLGRIADPDRMTIGIVGSIVFATALLPRLIWRKSAAAKNSAPASA